MAETELKPCPFCGIIPHIRKIPLWHGTHGYHGCYEYDIRCTHCGCRVNLVKNQTIYIKDEETINNAVTAWNRRSDNGKL